MRGRLLRVARHGYCAAPSNATLLRNVRPATHARARSTASAQYSNKGWLQAGEIPHGFEGHECASASWLLGRSRLLQVLRPVTGIHYGNVSRCDRRHENRRNYRGRLRAPVHCASLPLGECSGVVCNGWKRFANLPRVPKLWSKNTRKSSDRLAEISCDWRLAWRCAAVAPNLHVDLPWHRHRISRLSDIQRELQASSI